MSEERRNVRLGFTDELYPEGTHICYLYNNDEERQRVLSLYVRNGLNEQDAVNYFADVDSADGLAQILNYLDIRVNGDTAHGQLEIVRALDAFFPNGRFEPDAVLERLRQLYLRRRAAGFAGARVTCEMSWAMRGIPGSERVVECEARINNLVQEVPLTAMCQYDARRFDGATIFDVINVHPVMMVRGHLVRNPFYIPPDQFLAGTNAASRHQ